LHTETLTRRRWYFRTKQ